MVCLLICWLMKLAQEGNLNPGHKILQIICIVFDLCAAVSSVPDARTRKSVEVFELNG